MAATDDRGTRPGWSRRRVWWWTIALATACICILVVLIVDELGPESDVTAPVTTDATAPDWSSNTTTTTEPPTPPTTQPSTTPSTVPPATLELVVGNGSGKVGRAKMTADRLSIHGYSAAKVADAEAVAETTAFFAPGHEGDALALAALLGLDADRVAPLPAVTPLRVEVPTADVVLVVGPELDPLPIETGSTNG